MRYLSLPHLFVAVFAAVLVLPALLKAGTEETSKHQEFVTVYSSNLYGEPEPCG